MRKLNWKAWVSIALVGAGLAIPSSVLAEEPIPVGAPSVYSEPIPYGARSFSNRGSMHFRADASVQDPGVMNHGPVRYASPLEAWIVDRNAVTYPPDYGWSRPVKRPVLNRVPVQYYRMDPEFWYGDPRAFQGIQTFPMVYQPTDTTQLGYTYTRVPTWQPNPNMIPGPPWPATWHRREAPEYTRSRYNGYPVGYGYGPGVMGGYAIDPYAVGPTMVPSEAGPAPAEANPSDLPKGEDLKPAAPPKAPEARRTVPFDQIPSALRIGQPRR